MEQEPIVTEEVQHHSKELQNDPDGFQRALKPIRVRVSKVATTNIENSFQRLLEYEDNQEDRVHCSL